MALIVGNLLNSATLDLAVIKAPDTSERNAVTPEGDFAALKLRAATGQLNEIFETYDDTGNLVFSISPSSGILIAKTRIVNGASTTRTQTTPDLTGTLIVAASTSTTNTQIAMATTTAGGIAFNTMSGDAAIGSTGILTIANNAVSLAKMATMATASILGRNTAGTGIPEVLSASTTKTLLSLNLVENTALSTWTGSTNIAQLGTITSGGWQGTKIGLKYGGTNSDLSATGGTSQVLQQASAGAAITVGQLRVSDLVDGSTGTGTVVLATSPTIVTPTIASFTNATHSHQNAAGGGSLDAAAIASGTLAVARTASGLYLGSTVLTSASSTFTTGSTTNKIRIRIQAAGGGGGATPTTSSTQQGTAGGGGAGGYTEWYVAVSPSTAYTYTMDATGGAGGAVGSNPGTAGGPSTFIVGGTTVTVNGGSGGAFAPVGSGAIMGGVGGTGGALGTNGSLICSGMAGMHGFKVGTSAYTAGNGGSCQFGAGGKGPLSTAASSANGVAATGYGAGGSGAMTGASNAGGQTGGNGAPGVMIVDEFN